MTKVTLYIKALATTLILATIWVLEIFHTALIYQEF